MEVWLGAENPAETVFKYRLTVYFLLPPSPTSLADMRGEL
jgi:hypothetical protein